MKQSIGPTARAALQRAAEQYEITVEDMLAFGRRQECVLARQRAMVDLREQGWTTTRIARVFGFNHSSVVYHLRKAKETDNA